MGISLLHRRERLILTTIDIIDELGIQRLTTREIARKQEVSEATIFRHFQNKNDLLAAVLDYFAQFDKDISESVRLRNLKPLDALEFAVVAYAEYYENYPAITSILHLFDVLRYEPDLADKIKEIQIYRTAMLKNIVEDAINSGALCKHIDGDLIAVMIMGLIREISFNWRLNHCSFSLRERIQATLQLLIESFRAEGEEAVTG